MAVKPRPISKANLCPRPKNEEGAEQTQENEKTAIVDGQGKSPRLRSGGDGSRISATAKVDAYRIKAHANNDEGRQHFEGEGGMRKKGPISAEEDLEKPCLGGEPSPQNRPPSFVHGSLAFCHFRGCFPAAEGQLGPGWRISDPDSEAKREEEKAEDGESDSRCGWKAPDEHFNDDRFFTFFIDVCEALFERVIQGMISEVKECDSCQQEEHADDHTPRCALLKGTHTAPKRIRRPEKV